MSRLILIVATCVMFDWAAAPSIARAQAQLGGCRTYNADSPINAERQGDHWTLRGTAQRPVQIDCDEMQFFADQVEVFEDTSRVVAVGHVLFVSGGNRIAAERMEFNTKTRTGTFYTASGSATLGDRVDRSLFGTQEPDAMFYGEQIEKAGPKKYRIVNGGFTTCVQPTPRWEMVSGSVTLNMDDYALLRNAIFRVKGVPVMYLPVFYYPMEEDDRSTGFLIPTYGASTVRGQSISNAFFWAIGRSHDATFLHDWFSKAGTGMGGEYRYVAGPGSQGDARMYVLRERERVADANTPAQPARRSYQVTGSLAQRLPRQLFARANADYFSSITTQQQFQQDVYHATNRSRRFGAQLTGNWSAVSLSATAERNDVFYNEDSLQTNGVLPRVTLSRGERPIARSPVYFGMVGEYVTIQRSTTENDIKTLDQGLTKAEVTPSIRVPFNRWQFLTLNTSLSWRATYWSESLQRPTDGAAAIQVPESISRRFFDFQTRITGPVFNRIFNTPGGGFAEKYKHVIEPSLTIQRTTAIDNLDQIVPLEGSDSIVGGMTRFNYALSNRLYAKKEVSREILTATISQSYYTDARAAAFDRNYQSSFGKTAPSHYSPVAFQLRASPTDRFQADFRTEWDPTAHALRTLGANGTVNSSWLQATAGWSQRRFIPTLPGFDDPLRADHYLNAAATIRRPGNRIGGTYSFNYDLRRDTYLQQRYLAYYNAQCCGVAVEYQTFNFQGFTGLGIPQDRRFNLSFSLAGIGTFSNFFGALGGQQNR